MEPTSVGSWAQWACCYGSEFTSWQLLAWSEDRNVGLVHIQPHRPMQNGHVRRLHGRLREPWLALIECSRISATFWIWAWPEIYPHPVPTNEVVEDGQSGSDPAWLCLTVLISVTTIHRPKRKRL